MLLIKKKKKQLYLLIKLYKKYCKLSPSFGLLFCVVFVIFIELKKKKNIMQNEGTLRYASIKLL